MIDDATKEIVRRRANYLCEYCHSPERISTTRLTVDHLIPKPIGGSGEQGKLIVVNEALGESAEIKLLL